MTKETLNKIRKGTQLIFLAIIIVGIIILFYLGAQTNETTILHPAPPPAPYPIDTPKSVPYNFITDVPTEGIVAVLLGLSYYACKKVIDLIFVMIEKKLCK